MLTNILQNLKSLMMSWNNRFKFDVHIQLRHTHSCFLFILYSTEVV